MRTAVFLLCLVAAPVHANTLRTEIARDYEAHLEALFIHFHRNPELSLLETETAERLAGELREAGFKVHEGVGGTGVVALLRNGPGPTVMMRADMDGLPVEEKSGLPYASTATQENTEGELVPVMHACGHDVHITALVGTARRMAALRNDWSGTLMLIGQPAEERVMGAKAMMKDDLWDRFGRPDFALAFHVSANLEAGKIDLKTGAPYAGADTVEIVIHGVGAHGASPHSGKDPIVLGSQIVLALQTLVSRELPPREPGVVTVGTFHSGTKSNIISDRAVLTLTVRSTNERTRKTLLEGIQRIAANLGRAAGLPEDRLPQVTVSRESTPPTVNDDALVERLKQVWAEQMGAEMLVEKPILHMGAEDFPYFTRDPYIPSAYWQVGGTPAEDFDRTARGGPPVPSHHSPLFKVAPRPSITSGVEATVTALLDLFADPAPGAR